MTDDSRLSDFPAEDNVDDFDEAYAERRTAAIAAGRRKGGVAGAAMAGAMMALSEIYEGPKRDESVAIAESPDKPKDLDKDGFEATIGDVDLASHPPTIDDLNAIAD